ncbi:hypothetical protein [Photobacterium leiognathi]|uniref:hypothetical protein n=1 Tax=Photobacterium leiognathi TaxID=553611 RepID=UPI002981E242|nr:hypothetical protein [Photobacterium leiognathi]
MNEAKILIAFSSPIGFDFKNLIGNVDVGLLEIVNKVDGTLTRIDTNGYNIENGVITASLEDSTYTEDENSSTESYEWQPLLTNPENFQVSVFLNAEANSPDNEQQTWYGNAQLQIGEQSLPVAIDGTTCFTNDVITTTAKTIADAYEHKDTNLIVLANTDNIKTCEQSELQEMILKCLKGEQSQDQKVVKVNDFDRSKIIGVAEQVVNNPNMVFLDDISY